MSIIRVNSCLISNLKSIHRITFVLVMEHISLSIKAVSTSGKQRLGTTESSCVLLKALWFPFPHPGGFYIPTSSFFSRSSFLLFYCSMLVFLFYSILLFSQVKCINYLSIFSFQSFSLHILSQQSAYQPTGLQNKVLSMGRQYGMYSS